jgi:hypothetical protein
MPRLFKTSSAPHTFHAMPALGGCAFLEKPRNLIETMFGFGWDRTHWMLYAAIRENMGSGF